MSQIVLLSPFLARSSRRGRVWEIFSMNLYFMQTYSQNPHARLHKKGRSIGIAVFEKRHCRRVQGEQFGTRASQYYCNHGNRKVYELYFTRRRRTCDLWNNNKKYLEHLAKRRCSSFTFVSMVHPITLRTTRHFNQTIILTSSVVTSVLVESRDTVWASGNTWH